MYTSSPDTYLSRQALSNLSLCSLSHSLNVACICFSCTHLPFLSLNVSASFKHVTRLSHLFSFLINVSSHWDRVNEKGDEGARERERVKWSMNSSPSSNKLSLEGTGNNPCGLVQSNSNPQHIITMAGSPLHCCSRTGAGGVHMETHTHTLVVDVVAVVTIIISGSNLGRVCRFLNIILHH